MTGHSLNIVGYIVFVCFACLRACNMLSRHSLLSRRHWRAQRVMTTSTASSPLPMAQMRDRPNGSGWTVATRKLADSPRIRSRRTTRCGTACGQVQGAHVQSEPCATYCFCPCLSKLQCRTTSHAIGCL